MTRIQRLGSLAAIALGVLPGAAMASVNWGNPNGSTFLFSWSNGYQNLGLFGDPIVVGNTFVFTPNSFSATRPGTATRTDTLQVTIQAQPGQTITGIIIREYGTRTSTGLTTIQSTMFIKDLTDPNIAQLVDPMTYVNVGTAPNISWSGTVSHFGLNFNDATPIQLALTNNLTALVNGQTIIKNRVEIEILPSPGSVALLAASGLVAVRRRRR